jgi:uncharacterized membrane protein YqaE (UPF0057 family)
MNRNWIVLVLAIVSLASCSVEKRVYQPGYHIEWNHFAAQDAAQDAERDVTQDATQDAERDVTQDAAQDAERDVTQDAAQDAERDVTQDATQDASRDVAQDATQDASRDVVQDASPELSENPETFVSKGMGQSIDSDLELILFIVLALFLPALTIFLLEGFSKNFWIALLLMVLAFSLPLPIFLKLMIEAIATVLAIAVVLHYL